MKLIIIYILDKISITEKKNIFHIVSKFYNGILIFIHFNQYLEFFSSILKCAAYLAYIPCSDSYP